ncbi:MAG: hypothetical protein LBR83_03400 [Clostridiales bacterium]|nr:hypothetical protein [Clostridiales bacterium]
MTDVNLLYLECADGRIYLGPSSSFQAKDTYFGVLSSFLRRDLIVALLGGLRYRITFFYRDVANRFADLWKYCDVIENSTGMSLVADNADLRLLTDVIIDGTSWDVSGVLEIDVIDVHGQTIYAITSEDDGAGISIRYHDGNVEMKTHLLEQIKKTVSVYRMNITEVSP